MAQEVLIPIRLDPKNVQADAQALAQKVDSAFSSKAMQQQNREVQQVAFSMKNLKNQVVEVATALDKAKNTPVPTAQLESYQQQLKDIQLELIGLDAKAKSWIERGRDTESPVFKEWQADADKLAKQYDILIDKMEQLDAEGKAYEIDTGQVTELEGKLGVLNDKLALQYNRYQGIVNKQREQVPILTKIKALAVTIGAGFKGLLGHIRNGLSHLAKWPNALKKAAAQANQAKNSFKQMAKSMMQMTLGVASLALLFRKLIAFGKEGFSNLVGELNKGTIEAQYNTDLLRGKMTQLKNAIGAIAAPILNVITPAIAALADMLTNMLNNVTMFVGALTGAKTVAVARFLGAEEGAKLDTDRQKEAKATAQAELKEAKAAEKLAKAQEKANKQLAGFDELNNLTTKDTSTSDLDLSDFLDDSKVLMFEVVDVPNKFAGLIDTLKQMLKDADLTDFGRIVGEGLKNFLSGIPWAKIQTNAQKLGKALATLINGFIRVDSLGNTIGKTFAEGINTIFNALYGFIHNLDWKALGHFFADGLNGLFENIDWDLIKKTVKEGVQGIVDAINQFIKDFHWDNISTTLSNAINTVVDALYTFFSGIEFEDLGYNISTQLVKTIQEIDWKHLGETLGEVLKSAFNFLKGLIEGFIDGDTGTVIITALTDFFTGLFESLGLSDIMQSVFGEGSFIDSIISIGESIAQNLLGGVKSWIETDGPSIQESFTNIFDIWTDIGDKLSVYLQDLSDIFSAWNSSDGQQITSDLLSIFSTAFTSAIELGSQFMSDLVSLVVDPIHEHAEDIKLVLEDFIGYASEITDFIKDIVNQVKDTLETVYNDHVKPLFDTLKEVISGAMDAIFAVWQDTLKPVIDGIVADFPEIQATVMPVIEEVGEAIGAFLDFVSANVKLVYENLKPVFAWIHEHIGPVLKKLLSEGWELVKTVFEDIMNLVKTFFSFIKNVFKLFTDIINGDWDAAWEDCKNIIKNGVDFIKGIIQGLADFFSGIFNGLSESASGWGTDLVSNLASGINDHKSWVTNAASTVADKIHSFLHFSKPDEGPLSDFDSYMPDMMKALANGIKQNMKLVQTEIKTLTDMMYKMIKGLDTHMLGESLTDALTKGLQKGESGIYGIITNIVNTMSSAISGMGNQAYSWGTDMMQGLVNGIYNMYRNVANAASDVASVIWDYLHFSEPEKGALKNFHTFMPDMMDTMVLGIEQGIPDVEKALNQLSYGIAGGTIIPPKMAENIGRNAATQTANSFDFGTLSAIITSALGQANLGNNVDDRDIVIQIDGNTIFRAVRNENESFIKRTGRSAFAY